MGGAAVGTQVTEKVLSAYFKCIRKSYLLMFSRDLSMPTEYELVIEDRKKSARENYFQRKSVPAVVNMKEIADMIPAGGLIIETDKSLSSGIFSTENAIFKMVPGKSGFEEAQYEPIIFANSTVVRQEDKNEVSFVGYVLSQIQNIAPVRGRVILLDASEKTVRLSDGINRIVPAIDALTGWVASRPEPPATILNKHCQNCEFQNVCIPIAEREDSISLLSGIGEKELSRYERKGIFTVKQLSFLYRPPKHKRKGRLKPRPAKHKYELQALAIRTKNIYLHGDPIAIPRAETEIFFDIEAIPDIEFHYLIGMIVCTSGKMQAFQFWAERLEDEGLIWEKFIGLISLHPGCPLFHYGSFERKVIQKLGKLYNTPTKPILDRLFNVNNCIYGKIYFPVRSNSLKDLCRYLGLSWSSPIASGLQSIVWRYRYDKDNDQACRQMLFTYNQEDCENLRRLTEKLRDIATNGTHSPEIRFADIKGGSLTEGASDLVGSLNKLLHSAHLSYEHAKIVLKKSARTNVANPKQNNPDLRARSTREKPHKIVNVQRGRTCPHHPGKALKWRSAESVQTITDLVFTERGVKKLITQYVGKMGYCNACNTEYSPPAIRRLGRGQKYGHGLRVWAAYHRMALRLPFDRISQLIEEMFHERIVGNQIYNMVTQLSRYYVYTEKLLLKKILTSPVVHADETTINILGASQYVWVITDGQHVVFRHTESREASIIHDLFDGFSGVLCSDFYPGYDSVKCLQQKCWAHLIRDLNDDLRKSPFDAELEAFVSSVRDLIVPMFDAIEKYGLKVRNLRKFRSNVDQFYDRQILGKTYRSELVSTYQKRFVKYREKLFVFLNRDGVPWNNNMAERALRHLAVQRKISGSFGKDGILHYLLLLGITQSCRFQNKSLLQFLLSGEKDLDRFKGRKDSGGWRMH